MRRVALVTAIASALVLAPAPARAELEWVPEGRFFGRYSFPVQGAGRAGPDSNFELVSARLGTRLLIAPGIQVRAVGELNSLDRSRRVGDLYLGYAEWRTEAVGVLRLGQVPGFRDIDEKVTGDPVLGPGANTAAGFFYPSGLGLSWTEDFALDFASASVDVLGMYTEGLPGSGALADSPLFDGVTGTGPALLAHAELSLPGGAQVHGFARYGVLLDQQAALAWTQPLGDLDILLTAGASVSNPSGLPTTTDVAAGSRVRYNLAGLWTSFWRADVVGRVHAVARNVGSTVTTDPRFVIPSPRTDLQSSVALQYRVTDNTVVALDLTEDRVVSPAASSSLFLGARAGVQF